MHPGKLSDLIKSGHQAHTQACGLAFPVSSVPSGRLIEHIPAQVVSLLPKIVIQHLPNQAVELLLRVVFHMGDSSSMYPDSCLISMRVDIKHIPRQVV